MNKNLIQETARKCLEVPYHHQARDPAVALDCIGLLVWVASQLGCEVLDRMDYDAYSRGVDLISELDKQKYLKRIVVADLDVGDVIVFYIRHPQRPTHIGIKTDMGFIHTFNGMRNARVVETALDGHWLPRIYSVYRFVGLGLE